MTESEKSLINNQSTKISMGDGDDVDGFFVARVDAYCYVFIMLVIFAFVLFFYVLIYNVLYL